MDYKVGERSVVNGSIVELVGELRSMSSDYDFTPKPLGLTRGFVRRRQDVYESFTIGFNPLASRPAETGIDAAISHSAAALISLNSLRKWTLGSRNQEIEPKALNIYFCAAAGERLSIPANNGAFNMRYGFDEGTVEIESNENTVKSSDLSWRPEYVLEVLSAIRAATIIDVHKAKT